MAKIKNFPTLPSVDDFSPENCVIFGTNRLKLKMPKQEAERAMKHFGVKTLDELADFIPTILVGFLMKTKGLDNPDFFNFASAGTNDGLYNNMKQANVFMSDRVESWLAQGIIRYKDNSEEIPPSDYPVQ